MAAQVTGDGVRTVRQLVAALKRSRQQGLSDVVFIKGADVALDQEAARVLRHQGLDFDTVPATGRAVRLRGNANMSTGGTAVDVTRAVHPDNRRMAERAARLMGLAAAGIDYRTADISRSWRESPSAILAVDAGPGPQPRLPATADPDLPDTLIDRLFPAGSNGRVPLAGITGSLGKTTTCRMLAAILAAAGHVVALASTQGTAIGDEAVRAGDRASGICGAELLLDPAVTAGVFEMARGGLIKHGLGVDRVDVGAVLNVLDNHIGLDGMNNREDLARVKRLVVRNARRMAALNADDPLCLAMAEDLQAPVCLVSEQPGAGAVRDHLAAGGMAVTRGDVGGSPSLVLRRGGEVLGEIALAEIPATFGGRFRPAVLNAMFATAVAHGMGIGFEIIRAALGAFESTYATNPGRMNYIPGLPFQLLLTWADGPQALREIADFARDGHARQDRTLVFYSVGNRPDGFIIDSAKAVAGGFTRYVCTEMEEDLRGRQPGEVAHLLARGLREAGVPDEAIRIEPSSSAASRDALATTPAGALLVIESFRPRNVMAEVRKTADNQASSILL
jgi:cyanophycin synthetase